MVWSRVAARAAVTGLHGLPQLHSQTSTAGSWGIATEPKSPALHIAHTQPLFLRMAGLSGRLSPPACRPWGDTHSPEPLWSSSSFPAEPNPHHALPPPAAAEARAALPSLASSCFTRHNLEVLNEIATSSQTRYKKKEGARKGQV